MYKDKRMVVLRDAYTGAKQRCTNPKNRKWKDYGGRGIQFLFTSVNQLFREVGFRPQGKHGKRAMYSLDRICNDGNYAQGNVRWATIKEQIHNREREISRVDTERQEVLVDYALAVMSNIEM